MNHLSVEQQSLLILLQQSLWRKSDQLPEKINWEFVDKYATQQGVVALAYDGATTLKADLPTELRQKWSQKTLMGVMKNERLLVAQDMVLGWLAQHGIPAVILKGSSVSRFYPQPDLRVLGDIDILIPEENIPQAKDIMLQNGYTFHESDHEFHLGFSKPGAYVEIHYNVTTLPNCQGADATQAEITHFLDVQQKACVVGHNFPVLVQHYQSLSLLLHMVRHMVSGGIGLRQLCDWTVHVANTDLAEFIKFTIPMLEKCGLLRYAQVATWACVRYLGLPRKYATWCESVSDAHAFAFLQDVFRGGNMGSADPEKMGRALSHSNATGDKQSFSKMVLSSLTELVFRNFPFVKKYKVLLPLFWIYLPIRYWIRSLFGVREKKSLITAAKNAKIQQDFYNMLGIFDAQG